MWINTIHTIAILLALNTTTWKKHVLTTKNLEKNGENMEKITKVWSKQSVSYTT